MLRFADEYKALTAMRDAGIHHEAAAMWVTRDQDELLVITKGRKRRLSCIGLLAEVPEARDVAQVLIETGNQTGVHAKSSVLEAPTTKLGSVHRKDFQRDLQGVVQSTLSSLTQSTYSEGPGGASRAQWRELSSRMDRQDAAIAELKGMIAQLLRGAVGVPGPAAPTKPPTPPIASL